MATLKCLACEHDNNVGEVWCASCSSSLNLRLCSACEAINANDAERCHSCNAEFRIEPQVVTFDMGAAPSREPVEAAALAGNALPAVLRLSTGHARTRSSRFTAVLAVLPLLAVGAAYYFSYAASRAGEAPHVAPNVEAARKSDPAPDAEAAPGEPARPQTAEVKPAQAPAVSGKIIAPRTATAPARTAASAQPKRMTAAVTHTRSATAAATTLPVPTTVPVSTTLPVSAASEPALEAPILAVSESPAAISDLRRTSITHTKADHAESAPAGCAPAVAALGLCKSR